MPMHRPISDESPARQQAARLISVSAHSRYSPLRLSGVNAIREMAPASAQAGQQLILRVGFQPHRRTDKPGGDQQDERQQISVRRMPRVGWRLMWRMAFLSFISLPAAAIFTKLSSKRSFTLAASPAETLPGKGHADKPHSAPLTQQPFSNENCPRAAWFSPDPAS
jgi:hypothetical protein